VKKLSDAQGREKLRKRNGIRRGIGDEKSGHEEMKKRHENQEVVDARAKLDSERMKKESLKFQISPRAT
jgi:hypothetical protein